MEKEKFSGEKSEVRGGYISLLLHGRIGNSFEALKQKFECNCMKFLMKIVDYQRIEKMKGAKSIPPLSSLILPGIPFSTGGFAAFLII